GTGQRGPSGAVSRRAGTRSAALRAPVGPRLQAAALSERRARLEGGARAQKARFDSPPSPPRRRLRLLPFLQLSLLPGVPRRARRRIARRTGADGGAGLD